MPRYKARERLQHVNGGRRYVKISVAAKYIGVSEATIRVMMSDGRLTRYQLGPRVLRVDLNEVDALMVDDGVRAPDRTGKAQAVRAALLKAKAEGVDAKT